MIAGRVSFHNFRRVTHSRASPRTTGLLASAVTNVGGGIRGRVTYIETHQRDLQRRRRISAVHPAREARRALESVTGTAAARGPPPERSKTRENAMFVKPGSAAGARRRGERAVAACFLLRSSENRTTLCAPLGPPSRKRAWRTVRTAHTLLALFARE
jgi:hypothetical protein